MTSGSKGTLGWVAASQGLSAVGTVIGIRILTQHLDPATFGIVTLAVGAAALVINVLCTPLTQAASYFYPSLAGPGGPTDRDATATLRTALWRGLLRTLPWFLAALLLFTVLYAGLGTGSVWIVAASTALVICDAWRAINFCLLNAASKHGKYGIWMALEAWGRPLCATAAVLLVGQSALAVLWAYVGVSFVLNLSLSRPSAPSDGPAAETAQLDRRIWQYALPLVPLGLIGWANGLSDRYIIGGMLSLHDTGIYAAAYGLASRPLLLVNAAFEQFFRPLYQNAVSRRRTEQASTLLRSWFMTLVAANTVLVLIIFVWRDTLAALLLGPQYRSGAALMPWIASGYALLSVSYVFERICYAHAHTRRVLAIQSLTGIAAVTTTVIGVREWGLPGAAIAVPIYFSVQLMAAIFFGRRSRYHADMLEPGPA